MSRQALLFLLLAIAVTLACYLPAFQNGWTDLDDQGYVYTNEMIKHLSFSNLSLFFSTYQLGNYHPLTMLSLALDYKLFGLSAGGYHAHAVILHLLNVILVFFLIYLLTSNFEFQKRNSRLTTSFLVALFFGIHPAHVESVAWVSERKDLLYTFYYLAGLITYIIYVRSGNKRYYICTIILFLFSCLSKGQAVTFPVALLLIDYYLQQKNQRKLWLEKIPLFLISIIFGIVAVKAQESAGAFHIHVSFGDKIIYASYSLFSYIYKSIVPIPLAAVYPYLAHKTFLMELSPVIVLLLFIALWYLISKLANQQISKSIFFGFGFFLINVLLILQFLSVGGAIMADRYTYLAYIGLFFIVSHAITHRILNSQFSILNFIIPISFIIFFSIKTFVRTSVWKNSGTLYSDMLQYSSINPGANAGLADYYLKQNQTDSAYKYFNLAMQYDPQFGDALNNFAFNLADKGKELDKAEELIKQALKKEVNGYYLDTYGWILYKEGRYAEAKQQLEKAIETHDVKDSSVSEHYKEVLNHIK